MRYYVALLIRDGFAPMYIMIDGISMTVLKNPKHPKDPWRFNKLTTAMQACEKLNGIEEKRQINEG